MEFIVRVTEAPRLPANWRSADTRGQARRLAFSCSRMAIEASVSATFINTTICRQAAP